MFSNKLGSKFGIASLVKGLPFLTGFVLTDTVNINTPSPKLAQEFRGEHRTSKVANWHQVELTAPCQFPQPEIVVLLVHQGRHG